MGQAQQSRVWIAVAIAALLAMAAVIWIPAIQAPSATLSPLATPSGTDSTPTDAPGEGLSALAKVGLTLPWVVSGIVLGVTVIAVTRHLRSRDSR